MENKILEALIEQKNMGLKGNLYHYTQVNFAYNTNHIEGSTLTEDQTSLIFDNTLTFDSKNDVVKVDDIIETSNHFRLVDYMLDTIYEPLSEDLIKKFHEILKTGTSDERKSWFNVGEYKKLENVIGGITKTVSPKNVHSNMLMIINDYNGKENITINDIIDFHVKFESIHPFQDGNGRVGRIIMFRECLKNNIVPFIILDSDKQFYYRGLKEYKNEKSFLIDTCLNAQDQYQSYVNHFLP